MVRRRDCRQALAPQALRIQFRIVDRTKRERQVNPVLAESNQLLACGSFPQLESQIPVAGEYSQNTAEYVGAERSKEANGQPSEHAAPGVGEFQLQPCELIRNPGGPLGEDFSGRRQTNSTRVPFNQIGANLLARDAGYVASSWAG